MTTYYSHGVNLSEGQMRSLQNAIEKSMPVTLRLLNHQLTGNHNLNLTKSQIGRIQKAMKDGKGADIKISRTGVRKIGGGWGRSLFRIGRKMLPKLAKKVAPGLMTGVASSLASHATDKALGSGYQKGGFMIQPPMMSKLLPFENLLTSKQMRDITRGLSTMTPVFLKPTVKQQRGGFLRTLLASMLLPAAVEGISELAGSGLQNRPSYARRPPPRRYWPKPTQDGGLVLPYQYTRPPPFIGSWPKGAGKKKLQERD